MTLKLLANLLITITIYEVLNMHDLINSSHSNKPYWLCLILHILLELKIIIMF